MATLHVDLPGILVEVEMDGSDAYRVLRGIVTILEELQDVAAFIRQGHVRIAREIKDGN